MLQIWERYDSVLLLKWVKDYSSSFDMSLTELKLKRQITVSPSMLNEDLQTNIFEAARRSFLGKIISGTFILKIKSVVKSGLIKVVENMCQLYVDIQAVGYSVDIGNHVRLSISHGSKLGSYGRDTRIDHNIALFFLPNDHLESDDNVEVRVYACKIEHNMFVALCELI